MPTNKINKSKNAQGGKRKQPCLPTLLTYEVYDGEYTHVHTVPKEAIHQVPHKMFNVNRLVVCRNHSIEKARKTKNGTNGGCEMGALCKFVHLKAPLDCFPKQEVHVNYAWRSVEAVKYERLVVGEDSTVVHATFPLSVAEDDGCEKNSPTAHNGTKVVPSTKLLLTEGAMVAMREAQCLHRHQDLSASSAFSSHNVCNAFFFDRMCNHGPSCKDLHVFHIDPEAKEFQRAPCPRYPTRTTAASPITPVGAADEDEKLIPFIPTNSVSMTPKHGSLSCLTASLNNPSSHNGSVAMLRLSSGGDRSRTSPAECSGVPIVSFPTSALADNAAMFSLVEEEAPNSIYNSSQEEVVVSISSSTTTTATTAAVVSSASSSSSSSRQPAFVWNPYGAADHDIRVLTTEKFVC